MSGIAGLAPDKVGGADQDVPCVWCLPAPRGWAEWRPGGVGREQVSGLLAVVGRLSRRCGLPGGVCRASRRLAAFFGPEGCGRCWLGDLDEWLIAVPEHLVSVFA